MINGLKRQYDDTSTCWLAGCCAGVLITGVKHLTYKSLFFVKIAKKDQSVLCVTTAAAAASSTELESRALLLLPPPLLLWHLPGVGNAHAEFGIPIIIKVCVSKIFNHVSVCIYVRVGDIHFLYRGSAYLVSSSQVQGNSSNWVVFPYSPVLHSGPVWSLVVDSGLCAIFINC